MQINSFQPGISMFRSILIFPIILIASLHSFGQDLLTSSLLNLSFEKIEKGYPVGWKNAGQGGYAVALDSTTVYNGKYSVNIEFKGGGANFETWTYILPDNYEGKNITLTGYIKTENVTDGYAGLWMRIDPEIGFDNMSDRGITGSTDWMPYEITLEMHPAKTKQIVLGGLMVGKGKMWMDDLKITIDGKDIETLSPIAKKVYPAESDKEFDAGSGIDHFSLSETKIDDLQTLGLIWGFLKYYHPKVAEGQFNWDYELFRVLPSIINTKNTNDRDAILVNWINRLGEVVDLPSLESTTANSSTADAQIKLKPDLDWIKNSSLSKELENSLLKIKNANHPEEHYYISLQPNVGNPDFTNENPYPSFKFPDTGYRLLALYRYWNMIQYYFPYKNLIEEDWKNILKEFIPKFVNAKNENEYTLSALELIGRVHDTHANIWGLNETLTNFKGSNYAAVEINFIEKKAVVTGFYDDILGEKTGLKTGDIISKVNNRPVEEIIAEKIVLTPASNYPTQLRDIASNLLRSNDTTITVEFIRLKSPHQTILATYPPDKINIYKKFASRDTSFKLINNEIAYINHGTLKRTHLPEIWNTLKETKGIIIDIRNYPSDFPIYDFSNYLLPKGEAFVKFTKGSITEPGLFTYTEPLIAGGENKDYYKGKVVILVNESTQSSAEFHSMAYRTAPNATVIGSTTAGADGNVSRIFLPGGIMSMISGIGVYYPDGSETQRIGIVPDIVVMPTIKGIREGRDELLEKAVEIINTF